MPEEHVVPAPPGPDTAQQEGEFSNLPNEIIAKVFVAGTEMWRDLDPQGLPFPVLVSGVCTHWRLLSHRTQELWTFILPPLHKGDAEECLRWVSEWFERSGAMLMSVVLDDRTGPGAPNNVDVDFTTQVIINLLKLVSHNVHRLRRLDIRTRHSTTFEKFIQNLQNAPNLQQLSLCARYRGGGVITTLIKAPELWKWSSLQNLPSLTKFRFQKISPPYISNLTSLTAYGLFVGYDSLKTLFTTSPHLSHLVLHKLRPIYSSNPAQNATIQIPSLRSIAVSYDTPNGVLQDRVYHFNLIVMPNLIYVEVDGGVPRSCMFDFSPSSSTIKTLRISNCSRLSESFDLQVYHSFTGLQHLELIRASARDLLPNNNSRLQELSRRRSIHFQKPAHRDPSGLDGPVTPRPKEAFDILVASSNPSQLSPSHTPWPELRSISLDTLAAGDVVSLVNFIKSRKGQIQCVHLSNPAMRHLSESMRRKDDEVVSLPFRHQIGSDDDLGTKDVQEWLDKFVDVKLLQSPSYGLLDVDRAPLSEML